MSKESAGSSANSSDPLSLLKPPALGKRITELRKKKGITEEVLSQRSGISAPMLREIEKETVSPTVATVWRIAKGLDVGLQGILTDEPELFEVLRKEDAPTLISEDQGCTIRITSPIHLADKLEMYHLRFRPKACLESAPHYQGTTEFLTALRGTFTVASGSRCGGVDAGDTVRYRADVRHAIRNRGQEEGEAYLIVQFEVGE